MKWICMFLAVMCFAACNEEEALTPTERPEFGYSVPQGDHDYDDRIVDWNERCNTFILYKFNLKELYWQVTSWSEPQKTPEGDTYPQPYKNSGIRGAVADENYVGQQLDLLETQFLDFYPDTTLRRCLPLKLLLCSELMWVVTSGAETPYNVYNGFDYLAFNWGNEAILTMTDEEKNVFKNEVNMAFLERILRNGKIIIPVEFMEGTNYEERPTTSNMYELGFVSTDRDELEVSDYLNYMKAVVSTPYDVLIAEPEDGDTSFKGILHEKKDVNGHILRKYTVMIEAFKNNYGIDLQAIGNATLD